MFRQWFCFFLVVHVLADFYLQSDKLATKKEESYRFVMLHGAIYIAASLVCIVPVWSIPAIITVVVLSALHFAVDSVKFLYTRKPRNETAMFAVDQLIHMGCIAIAASTLSFTGAKLALLPPITVYLTAVTKDSISGLVWLGLMLLVLKPANITIKRITAKYKPEDDSTDINKAGGFIGSLERLLILLLLSVGQYAAIGLVLTAKSVARYNKIAENKQFAEYYLLGTLLSALIAIGAYFLLAL